MHRLKLLLVVCTTLMIVSCSKDPSTTTENKLPTVADFDHTIINDWNQRFLEIERYADGYRPGPAPRGLAYLGLSAYEACLPGMKDFNSISTMWPAIVTPVSDETLEYNWPLVINASYNYLMPLFFSQASPQQRQTIENTYQLNLTKYSKDVSNEIVQRSISRGTQVAEAIWNWAKSDAIGHEHYLHPADGYDWTEHYHKFGDWKPTIPGPGKGIGGVWGKARTFALNSEADKICRPPIQFSENTSSEFYSQALETYTQNTPSLSYEKKWLAYYWSDDFNNVTFSPGPRWIAIGLQAMDISSSNLEDAVFATAKAGIALNDASVACWESKYYYNLERPETYIQRVIDPNWEPVLDNISTNDKGVTPPFPAYPSGHSTMGGAASEIYGNMFGYSFAMSDKCHADRTDFLGAPRNFPSFSAMAQENAWSRIPLGVHFRMDGEEGVRFGTEIGRKVNKLKWKK